MTRAEHHLLCVRLLEKLYRQAIEPSASYRINSTRIWWEDRKAIEQAIESAEALGLHVSAENLRKGLPVCKQAKN